MANKKNAPKNDRAAAARSQAQKSIKAQERKSTLGIVIGSLVALVVFGGIVFYIVQSSSVPALDEDGAVTPAGSDATGGIPVGTAGVVGEDVPEDAPRLDIYLDFMCPICGQFEDVNAEDIEAMRAAGDVQLYYHPISILDRFSNGTDFSTRAANAAATVADAAPEHFVEFSDAMFVNQPAEGTEGLSDAQIEEIAIGVGVPEDVAETLDDGIFTKWVIAATERASQDGMEGTPTVMVNQEILEQSDVPYFQPGALRTHIEGL